LTYNGGDGLRRVVRDLRAQEFPVDVEYVAVDSGSEDGSCAVLTDAGFSVHHVKKEEFSFGRIREYAFKCSTGDIIVTQSQDVFPLDRAYLAEMTGPIARNEADVVQGITVAPLEDDRVFLWDRLGVAYFTREGWAFMEQHGNIGLSCSCLAISREAWTATGFGETPYSEDKFIQKRLVERGFRIVSTTRPVASHGHSYSFNSLVKRCLNEGVGWRYAGVRYSVNACLRDLSGGFIKYLPMWWKAVRAGQVRGAGSLFFFQIRPVCVWVGNRLLKRTIS